MAKEERDYFGMGRFISIILAIIPVTSLILGVLTRIKEKKYFAGLLRLLVGWNLWWFLDLLCMLFKGSIFRLL